LVLKKCKKSDDVLFINASEHFTKGKRQNHLDDDDIEKIIDIYKERKEEKRYSRAVSLEEIEKNDFNLNISRYVSTAKPEEVINLDEVHCELKKSQEDMKKFMNEHNTYLKELGLELLV